MVFTGQSEIASDNLRAARLSLEISEGRHRKARYARAKAKKIARYARSLSTTLENE